MIVFIISAILVGTRFFLNPYGYFVTLATLYMGLQITSIMQIFAFAKPQSKSAIVPIQREITSSNGIVAIKRRSISPAHSKPVLPRPVS